MIDNGTPRQADERARVSILARLIPNLSYIMAAAGGAVSAFYLYRVLRALEVVESAGIGAAAGGVREAITSSIVGLSLAAVIGFVGIVVAIIRLFMATEWASPPTWFFVIPGLLGLIPTFAALAAQSAIVDPMLPQNAASSTTIADISRTVTLLVLMGIAAAIIAFPVNLAAAFIPFTARKGKKLMSLLILLLFEMAILLAIALIVYRIGWLYQVNDRLG